MPKGAGLQGRGLRRIDGIDPERHRLSSKKSAPGALIRAVPNNNVTATLRFLHIYHNVTISMSTPEQRYLDELEERIEESRLYPYALVVEDASDQINRALDPFSPSGDSLEDVISRAKEEIRSLAGT